jgi:hypothetical protein
MLDFRQKSESIEIPKNLKEKLEASDDKDALQKLKTLLCAAMNPDFRYSIHLQDEDADAFLLKMATAKPNPKMQKFLKQAKEYAQKHPIHTPE